MKRGEVYWASLAPRSGSEQTGRRPVIILSHDGFNQTPNWRSIIVVPVSSSLKQAGRSSTVVFLPKSTANLPKDCVAVCHQITTLDKAKLEDKIGELGFAEIQKVEQGIKAAIDLP